MITGTLTTTDHGSVMLLEGVQTSVDLGLIVDAAKSYPPREHLTLWTDCADRAFADLVGEEIPPGLRVGIRAGGLSAFHLGKVHVRSVGAFSECDPGELCHDYGEDIDAGGRLRAMREFMGELDTETRRLGAGGVKGTAATTAHNLWREGFNPSGRWRCPQDEGATDELDFIREGLYGGKTLASLKGCVHTPGNMPRALVKTLDAPAFETPPGHKIWRLDARSAYPAAMRGSMPYGWNHITEGFDLDHTHGIARVTIKLNEDGPRVVPLRLVTRAGVRTVWPEAPCTLYGVWSYFTLREAVAHGAEIVEVHEARSYMMTCKPLASFVRAVWSKQGAIPRDSVRKALKGYSRRLNGRFAVSRWRSNLIPLSEYFDRIALDPDAGMPNMVIGDHCVVREPMDNYPAYSQILWSISTVDRATVILTRIEDELERAGLPVLYRDTDSVMFSARDLGGKPEVPDAVSARMGDGLGEWRVDWVGDWAIIMGSKFYALDDGTCSFAGVPRDIQAELLHNGRATYQQRATAFNPSRAVTFNLSAGELFERES